MEIITMTVQDACKKSRQNLKIAQGDFTYFAITSLKEVGYAIDTLPYSIRILLESALRNNDGFQVTDEDVEKLAGWSPQTAGQTEIAFKPGRVILQDFTGVPCVVDLAAMRTAMKAMGGDPQKINPQVPCDLVIDHSVQVDRFGTETALKENMDIEFQRNQERYKFLKWGQNAFDNFRIVPPGRGIVHQVNLECLAQGVLKKELVGETVVYPDSLVGTDSHTTMINGLGVVGWGVGGIEAEAVMLGEPIYMVMPEVVGCELTGTLPDGVTATDLVLTLTQVLREKGVVGKFVEFFGEGSANMSLANRATIANMAPEYGATMGFFPVDSETLNYLRTTGREEDQVALVESYTKAQGLFYSPEALVPHYSTVVPFDIGTVVPSLAGPKRPHDRVALSDMKVEFEKILQAPVNEGGFAVEGEGLVASETMKNHTHDKFTHGAVVIAAITSCTNTSNPSVLIGAGLVAQKAIAKGLKVKPFVKTSLAPGSTAVTAYLKKANLLEPLSQLGFDVVGYGCTTCIGNSGSLSQEVSEVIQEGSLVVASVLSGNRNFEGRINPHVKANYLASPPLVVAYALVGTVTADWREKSLGQDSHGKDIYLKDIWPTQSEIDVVIQEVITSEQFADMRDNTFTGTSEWQSIDVVDSELYAWNENSSYIQNPPFFEDMDDEPKPISPIMGAKVLLKLGDSVTTDHISPAGAINADSPAGEFLQGLDISPEYFNSYGSRRGNDSIMTRGTFANIRLRNQLAPGTEGGWTTYFPENKVMSIYAASLKYKESGVPLVVLAGKEYGTGSSRDWAAKGTFLLGVRVVIAESYERIHRSNLIGMGVLPLQFKNSDTAQSLEITGEEVFDFPSLGDSIQAGDDVIVVVTKKDGSSFEWIAQARIDTPVEVEYFRNGGILQTVLRKLF
jgi:aconitate hydratase